MFDGIAVYLSLVLIFIWLGPVWRRHIARFGLVTDLAVHGTCQLLLGGHNQGRIATLFGCLMFSFTLMAYRKIKCRDLVA